jgi:hypothetical protein
MRQQARLRTSPSGLVMCALVRRDVGDCLNTPRLAALRGETAGCAGPADDRSAQPARPGLAGNRLHAGVTGTPRRPWEVIARRNTAHGSGLGIYPWVADQAVAPLRGVYWLAVLRCCPVWIVVARVSVAQV